MIDRDDLRQLQRDRAEDLCRHFFPAGKKLGAEWKLADYRGGRGDSLGVQLTGPKAGLWSDRATGDGGDFVSLIRASRNLGFVAAIEQIEGALGINLRSENGAALPEKNLRLIAPSQPVTYKGLPYKMTLEESRRCLKAAERLASSETDIERIARWRGWKKETIRALALDLCLGIEDGKLALIYETALKLRWRDADGRHFCFAFGTPFIWRALPLLSPSLRSKINRIYVTEGETDCITLVDRGFEKADLSQICVAIGGANQFKPEWASLFRDLNVTLVPDADDAGQQALGRWTELLAAHVKSLSRYDLSKLEGTNK